MQAPELRPHGFFHKGSSTGILLIHGITGAPAEMQFLGRKLNGAGFSVLCNSLPGHCAGLQALQAVTWQEIAAACAEDLRQLRSCCETVFVCGLSAGALLSLYLAAQQAEAVRGIVALAPTFFYDGWAVHKGRAVLELLWHIPFVRKRVLIPESHPFGLKDETLRSIIERLYRLQRHDTKAKQSAEALSFGSPFFPAACLYQHARFVKVVRPLLPTVKAPLLILHAREDDMVSLKNAEYCLRSCGSADKKLIVLTNSYHMITIDQEKEAVAQEVVAFLSRLAA